jgi:hypothetical protein
MVSSPVQIKIGYKTIATLQLFGDVAPALGDVRKGQTRRFRRVRGASGLPQTADTSGPGQHFAFVPEVDMEPRLVASLPEAFGA